MLSLKPSSLLTPQVGQVQGTGPSPRVMAHVAGQATGPEGHSRLHQGAEDDFQGELGVATGTGDIRGITYAADGAPVERTDEVGGYIQVPSGGQFNLKSGVAAVLGDPASQIEARLTVPAHASNSTAFVGWVTVEAAAVDGTISAAGGLQSNDGLGLHVVGNVVQLVAQTAGGGVSVIADNLATLDDGGIHKLGLTFSQGGREGHLKAFVDGVEVGRYTMKQLEDGGAPISDRYADTPVIIPLAAAASMLGTTATSYIDWIYAYHLFK